MPTVTREVVDRAKRAALLEHCSELSARHFLVGALAVPEARTLIAERWLQGRSLVIPPSLASVVESAAAAPAVTTSIPLGSDVKALFQRLWTAHGGMPPFAELFAQLGAVGDPSFALLATANSLQRETETRPVGALAEEPAAGGEVATLLDHVTSLQNLLARKVIGQREAVSQIADALFQARLFHREDDETPAAVFLFLGPPGVGKTYTAQLIARSLCGDDPDSFLRLDMSGYADEHSYRMLVGFEPSYQGARPGTLTEHVTAHPRGVVLIDEIEKAHPVVHNLFLQILDRGQLEDKFTKQSVSFGRTIVIVTTNLGKELYAAPGQSGFLGGAISRASVLETLRNAPHPLTGRPALSPELCSRLAKGYPILFNHFTPMDLEDVVRLAVEEISGEFEKRRNLQIAPPDPRILSLLILRLGPDLDARTLTAGIPLMLMDAYHQAVKLAAQSSAIDRLRTLVIEPPDGEGATIYEEIYSRSGKVLLIADRPPRKSSLDARGEITWTIVEGVEAALGALRKEVPHLVLVDVDLGGDVGEAPSAMSMAALRRLRSAHPEVPVVLFADRPLASAAERSRVDHLIECGSARNFLAGPISKWPSGEASPLEGIRRVLMRDRFLREKFRARQTLRFEWGIEILQEEGEGAINKDATVVLRPRDLHFQTVVASKDRVARLTFTGIPKERLADVAGAREAKQRLGEVIRWMRHPEALSALGVELPSGILLEGPPGNGKTLLARAVAGEANLPFFAAAATDFSSKWVGESEANIRELFERAATYAPSILFIDEIDAIGAARSSERSGVADQMLNQLLVSMDGFQRRDRPVFFLAATNRSDMLDPALKRPGRFDLIITIDDLDVQARRQLLAVKTREVPLADDVDLDQLAAASVGLSGAQLSQVAKEAAILAFREAGTESPPGSLKVAMRHLREGLTNVRFGLKREGAPPPAADLRATAVHEAGHALLAELERPGSVHQATILPRGRALGFVESLPEGEAHALTAAELFARIRVALAGRGAEVLVFGPAESSAGCSQDLEQATRLAVLAVTQFGMSSSLGPLSLPVLEKLLPGSGVSIRAQEEVETILKREEATVAGRLASHREALDSITTLLMTQETVAGDTIARVVAATSPGGV